MFRIFLLSILTMVCNIGTASYWVLPNYKIQLPADVNKPLFIRLYNQLKNHGVQLQQYGQSYQLLLPHSSMYKQNSAELSEQGYQVLINISKLLRLFPYSDLSLQSCAQQDTVNQHDELPELGGVKPMSQATLSWIRSRIIKDQLNHYKVNHKMARFLVLTPGCTIKSIYVPDYMKQQTFTLLSFSFTG
ncbi:MAG: hypothetical protein VXY77_01720 [Pseudomonadota bacterium]|nr:hypothetical protein [Pseudomonadota bacterium]